MNILRKLFLTFIIIGTFSYSAYTYLKGPCDEPLQYIVGNFSEKFGVSQADFVTALKEAEDIWETSVGKDLFVYSTVKGMPIHLIYDERQATADKNKKLEGKIDEVSDSAESVKRELEGVKIKYARSNTEYEAALIAFKTRQDAHIANIDYWNSNGGAPKAEYAQLTKEGDAIKALYASLEKDRISVNALATELNRLVSSYNTLVKNINSNVAVINQSADKEFEQGEYISDSEGVRINIYEFTDRETLIRVLAHELGHALGIEHNDNPESIMYYLNKDDSSLPSVEDIRDLKLVCKFSDTEQGT